MRRTGKIASPRDQPLRPSMTGHVGDERRRAPSEHLCSAYVRLRLTRRSSPIRASCLVAQWRSERVGAETLPINTRVDKSPLRRSFAFRQASRSLGCEGPLVHVAPSVVQHGSRIALQFSPIMNKRPIRICGTEGQSLRYEARLPLQTGHSRSFRSASFLCGNVACRAAKRRARVLILSRI